MKKIQIIEEKKIMTNLNAGSKAAIDAAQIADRLGYERMIIRNIEGNTIFQKVKRGLTLIADWNMCYRKIPNSSVVFVYSPFLMKCYNRSSILKKLKVKKNCKIVYLIHDIEQLRGLYSLEQRNEDFSFMLSIADKIIAHNPSMEKFLIEKGYNREKILNLKIFDYLSDIPMETVKFEKVVSIAGNLNVDKCGYIGKLKDVPDINFELYGVGYNENIIQRNVIYKGAFPANKLSKQFTKGFGLVWDGDSINSCTGPGEYLRYNNPHKLSLYLCSGMPVIVWKQSAEADFVIKENVGFVVDSLSEINEKFNSLTKDEYQRYSESAVRIGSLLRSGYYLTEALKNV